MLRLLTPITLFIALLTTGVPSSHAYWLETKPEPFDMRGVREDAPPGDQKGIFTVQDNFNLFTKADGTSPMLLPHSNYFAAADIVDANLPTFGIFSHPVQQTGDPIANLLYANLKIKKILADYAKIQERAIDLINNDTLAQNGKMDVENTIDIQQQLKVKKIALATLSQNAIIPEISDQANSEKKQADRRAILSFQNLQASLDKAQTDIQASYSSHQTGQITTPAIQHNTQAGNHQPRNSPTGKTKPSSSYSGGEVTLPWILELPFKIFNYLLVHKFTALFIGFLLLMFINLIFGSRS